MDGKLYCGLRGAWGAEGEKVSGKGSESCLGGDVLWGGGFLDMTKEGGGDPDRTMGAAPQPPVSGKWKEMPFLAWKTTVKSIAFNRWGSHMT